jgi:hypothetical protein
MHWQVSPGDAGKLCFDPFLRWIDDDRAAFAEYQLFHFDETEQGAMANIVGIDFIHLPLADEDDFVDSFGCHLDLDLIVVDARRAAVVYPKSSSGTRAIDGAASMTYMVSLPFF